jgi:hypothetical protein
MTLSATILVILLLSWPSIFAALEYWRTMTAIANEIGCTRSAISKSAVLWSKTLSLEPSLYMKSKQARVAYRKREKSSGTTIYRDGYAPCTKAITANLQTRVLRCEVDPEVGC